MKLQDDLYLTLGIRHSEDEKSDVGGKNWECSVWNSCYPSTEIWGNRQLFIPNLAALAPDFHVAGGLYNGVNCTAQGGPYAAVHILVEQVVWYKQLIMRLRSHMIQLTGE